MKRMILSKRFSILSLILVVTMLFAGQPALVSAQTNCLAPSNTLCTASGNVGIGTTSPSRRLQILTPASGDAFIYGTSADDGKHSIFGVDTTKRVMYWRMNDSRDYGWQFQDRDGAPHMIIDNHSNVTIGGNTIIGGNVGIGTTSPSRRLQILTPASGDAFIYGTSADDGKHSIFGVDTTKRVMYWRMNDSRDYGWQFQDRDGAPHMIIDNHSNVTIGGNTIIGGNVGIGTASPSRRLELLSPVSGEVFGFGTSADAGKHSHFGVDTISRMMYWRMNDSHDYGWQFQNTDDVPFMTITKDGNVGIGTSNPVAKLDVAGTTQTDVLVIDAGMDLAEPFDINGAETIEPGTVVAIDPDHPGQLRVATAAYDRTVAGVVSGAGGINPGLVMQQEGSVFAGSHPVALTGRVFVWADASNGAIVPGDLLTTSDTAGHAMKVADHERAQGAILGKAMTELKEGTGLVLILISLQ